MPTFRYQALNAAGQQVAGLVEADAVALAIAQLESAGLSVQSIGFAAPGEREIDPDPNTFRIVEEASPRLAPLPDAAAERAVVQSHLSAVLAQGRVIAPALRAYAQEIPAGRRRRELQTVCGILETGDAAEADREFSRLPEYWIPLLSAAASSQDAARVLREFLDESERAGELRGQLWRTLAYPAVVVAIASGVFVFLAIVVVPMFIEIFADFDLSLPRVTTWVIKIAAWITSGNALITVIAIAAVIAVLLAARRLAPNSFTAWFADSVAGLLTRSTTIAQFARFTADLLEAGIDVPSATRIAGLASRRPRMRRASWQLAHALETDAPLPAGARVLTATVLHSLLADMPQASRIHLLKEVSADYARRARGRLSWTGGIVEPLAIGMVGFVVISVVLALFVPLVDLVNNLSG